jgi:hypothetical protein
LLQFVLRNEDGTEINDETFQDYSYTWADYLTMGIGAGFTLKDVKEITLPDPVKNYDWKKLQTAIHKTDGFRISRMDYPGYVVFNFEKHE